MLSIKKCKAKLESNGAEFTESEIKLIRDFLYRIATIEYDSFKVKSKKDDSDIHKGVDGGSEGEWV